VYDAPQSYTNLYLCLGELLLLHKVRKAKSSPKLGSFFKLTKAQKATLYKKNKEAFSDALSFFRKHLTKVLLKKLQLPNRTLT
jgi:hypothetical protein